MATIFRWFVILALHVALTALPSLAAPTLDEPPQSAGEAVNQPGVISTGDLMRAQAEYERVMKGPGATDGGPIKALGPGIDCIEKLVHGHRRDGKIDPALITEASREFLATERGREWLEDLDKLKADTWFGDTVDGYFVDDVVATMFIVYARKPLDRPRTVLALQLIWIDGTWRVSLDLKEDAKLQGAEVVAAWKKLRSLTEARRKELMALVTRPLAAPLPLDGFYTVHWRQTDVILAFNTRGEVTVYTPQPEGGASMEACDYQILGDDVVIETRFSPLRLKIDRERSQTKNGRTHYALLLSNPRNLFPEAGAEPLFLKPFEKQERALSRPERAAEAAGPAEQPSEQAK